MHGYNNIHNLKVIYISHMHGNCIYHSHREINFVMLTFTLLVVLFASPSWAVLPQFSWDTLPVFFHSSNTTGIYNDDALKTIAKFKMATIEKWMGHDMKNIDDEDEMVLAMRAIKAANPKIATYFYMNSFKDRPEMTRMARELSENPNYYLRDSDGTRVKNGGGFYAFDLSNPDVRQWWLNICLNATKFANGDGCFCDSSQRENSKFYPEPPAKKLKSWGEGMLNLTRDVQEALGENKLLIGKYPGQPYVKAVQIESFEPKNDSIVSLMLGASHGQVVQAHVPISIECSGDLTNYLASFLIGAGQYSYFGCGNWNATGNDTRPLTWLPEYDKPLGAPKSTGVYNSQTGVWSRLFASGTKVLFDTNTNKGTIKWSQ